MGKGIKNFKLTKNYVLSKVSQITIFSVYFNIPENVIKYCIETGELITSPIREDTHPTCGFKYDNRGKLKFKDFAGYFWGDCFDAVALVITELYKIKIDISNPNDFIKVLQHITLTFKNIFYGKEIDKNLIYNINHTLNAIKKDKIHIEIVIRDWNEHDNNYWNQFNIDLNYLNINFVYPIEQYYINRKVNPQPKYFYNKEDPCYAYYLGIDKNNIPNFKLYFPKREKTETRFITNCNHLEGIFNLNKQYDIIVITKSSKDRLAIGCVMKHIESLYGGENLKSVGVINIPHETYKLRIEEYKWLISKLKENGKLLSLMDNDRTGKLEAIWLNNYFNIIPILIPKKLKVKDFAELINKYGFKETSKLVINTINNIKDYERNNISYSISAIKTTKDDDVPF